MKEQRPKSPALTIASTPLDEVRENLAACAAQVSRAAQLTQATVARLAQRSAEKLARAAQTLSRALSRAPQTFAGAVRAATAPVRANSRQLALVCKQAVTLAVCACLLLQPNAALATRGDSNHSPILTKETIPVNNPSNSPFDETKTSRAPVDPATVTDPATNPATQPQPSLHSYLNELAELISVTAAEPFPVPPPVDAAVSRKVPSLSNGRVGGNLRVYAGQSFSFDGGFTVTDETYVVGTPTVTVATNATYHGSVDDGGDAQPTGYTVAVNGTSRLVGKLHIRANALAFPADIPASVPAPAGTRIVNINTASDINNIGNWATLKELHINKSGETVTVPPGTYGAFSVDGNSRLNFSAGVYNFSDGFTFASNASIKVTGQTTINVGSSANISNTSLLLGDNTLSGDVKLNVLGALLVITGNASIKALVRVPNGTAQVAGASVVRGQVIADTLQIISNGNVDGDTASSGPAETTPPVVAITSPLNNTNTNSPTITVSGTASDPGTNASGIAQVTVNNVPANYNASNNTWTLANFPLAVGPNQLTARATDYAGNQATPHVITVNRPDTTAPTVTIASPTNGSSTQASSITISGSAADAGANQSGVNTVTVNNQPAQFNPQTGNWTFNNFQLSVGSNNPITAIATDHAGIQSPPVTINVIRLPPNDTTAPSLTITSPNDGAHTESATITVTGAVADSGTYPSGVKEVTVNGVLAIINGDCTWTRANVPLDEGPNTLIVIAKDNAGNSSQPQTRTVTRENLADTQAPTITITSPLNHATSSEATITVSGTALDSGPNATGVHRVVVNDREATYDPINHTWTITGVVLTEGPNTITAFAEDSATPPNRGNAVPVSVTLHTPDTKAPTVTITSPPGAFDTYDATVNLAGTAIDDGLNFTGVQSVTVNNQPASFNAGTGQWTLTNFPLEFGLNHIVVTATDGAPTPNHGLAELQVMRLQIPPPSLTINNPQNGSVLAATSITVAGSVSSLGSAPVTVTVNDQATPVNGGQFTKTVALVEGANTITIVATDGYSQHSQSSLSVIRDLLPPAVSFANVPATVQPGSSYQILVDAVDNIGVADVEFRVNGQPVATATAIPYQFTLTVPLAYAPDTTLLLSAIARDLTNTTAVATAQTRTGGPGGVSGYAFDDATGYVLPAVNVLLNDQAPAATDTLGVFNLVSTTPNGIVRLTKDGYTPVERLFSVSTGEGTSLFDARLTPLDSHANSIGPGGGTATGDGGRLQLNFNPGTLSEQTDVRVTSLSPQGLANLLPYGWSPVPGAVVDVRLATAGALPAFQSSAHLAISQVAGLTGTTPLALARYDETAHRWVVIALNLTATGDNGALAIDLPSAGQYAFLVADTGSTAPPAPTIGQPLTAAPPADSAALDSAQASALATPRSAVFSAAARSSISFLATSGTQLPSGVSIEASFGETYNLLGGRDSELVDRPAQDFVLYAYPATTSDQPNRLGAFFVAKPTRTDFTITEIFNANVHVEIRSGRQSRLGVLIDANGGALRGSDGSQLTIPANSVSSSQTVFFNNLSPQLANVSLPEGYEILAAYDVDLGSATLSNSATISVPGLTGDLTRIVVARLLTVGGQRSPKVVARALVNADEALSSTTTPPTVPSGVVLQGVTTTGRYVFIRVPRAFGYVKGAVTDASSGAALSLVKVSSNQTPFIDVTGADGQFVIVGAAGAGTLGANQIGAAALTTDATSSVNASLANQDAIANANIAVSSVQLQVESITPSSNAQNMIATTPVTITFNKPIAASSITGSSLTLSTSTGNPVLGSITVLAGNRVVVFTPAATLAASTTYKVSLSHTVRDIYGHQLAADFNSTFSTAATVTVNNRLRPEQISISYPDDSGMSTISIPANSVPEGSSILVVNNTNGSTVSTVAGTAALLLQIQARVGDELMLTITQPDGTQYRVTQAAYRRADGFVSVGSNGGTITSEDGTLLLQVPAGAIQGQADLKLSLAHESDINIPRTGEMDPSIAPFAGAVKIEAQGNFTNTQELHVELPAPANAQEGQHVFFMKPGRATFDGQEVDVWETVTSGRVENGKIKSTSPPFFGVTLAGAVIGITIATIFFVFMPVHVRALTGIVQKSVPGHPSLPIPGVLCTVTSTGGDHPVITTRTANNGRFALVNFAFTPDATVTVTASDNAGVSHLGVATPYLNTEPGLFGIQSLFATINFPPEYQGLSPALLQFEGRMLNLEPGQRDTLQESGRVVSGSRVKIKVTATPAVADFRGDLLVNGAAPTQLLWTKTTQDGSSTHEAEIEVNTQGSYSVNVTTFTVVNHPETKATANYNFIGLSNPNVRPPLPGPPNVTSVTPMDKAQQVDVGAKVRIEFSEPVKNLVPGTTVYLTQVGSAAKIGGQITSGDLPVDPQTPNISTIDFEPERKLEGGKEYKVTVTKDVVDTDAKKLDQQPADPEPQDFTSTFKTFQGLVLTENPLQDDSYRIAAYGEYAFTAHVNSGSAYNPTGLVTAYDVSAPQAPVKVGEAFLPGRPLAVAMTETNFVNIDNDIARPITYKRIAVVTTTQTPDITRPNNLWIYSLDFDVIPRPRLIGVVSLSIPEATPESPGHVTIHGKRAYIGASPRGGVIVVDLEQAIADFQRDVFNVIGRTGNPYDTDTVRLAILQQGGYDREAQKQKASYGNSNTDSTPVMGLSVIDQAVPAGASTHVAPVAYVVPNRPQLISFNLDPAKDGILNYYDGNSDGRDDRVLAMKDLNPVGYALDIKAVAGVIISGASKDLAVELGQDRFWIFDVTNPAAPTQYPSRTFAELGMAPTDTARRIELEDKLLYVMFNDKVAVIDISDPTHPYVTTTITGLGSGLRWFAVQDGFIFTLANDAGNGQSGVRISIGRAVAQVIVYGIERASPNICGNPVVVDRNTNRTAESAGIFFQVYGHDLPQAAKIIIRKVDVSGATPIEAVIDTLPAVLTDTGTPSIVTGEGVWNKGILIDQSFVYTAEVVLDEGKGTEFHSKKTEIPLSYLIPLMSQVIPVKANGNKQTGQFTYMLAGTANVKLEIDIPSQNRILLHPHQLPNNAPDVWDRSFGQQRESFDLPAPKPDGRYHFRFSATLGEDTSVVDVVEGEVVVGTSSTDVRKPGSPVVDGVELGSGNLALSALDLEIKGRGQSLSLARFYNSRAAGQFNALGYGWRHSYQVLLTRVAKRDDDGRLTGEIVYWLDGAEGGRQTFKDNPQNARMAAEKPYVGTLVKNTDASFDYFTKSHLKYHFRQPLDVDGDAYQNLFYLGNLDYIEEPNGNKINLRYDASGRMDRVTDSSGRSLNFEYELAETPFVGIIPGDPSTGGCVRKDKFKQLLTSLQQSRTGRAWRVKRVAGPGGVSLTYEYDDVGNLNFVRRAGYDDISSLTSDRVWQYAYNPGSPNEARYEHLLKSVTAPNNGSEITRVTTYEYDLTKPLLNPVKKINLPESVSHRFEYQLSENDTKVSKADWFDGKDQKTTYTLDADGRPTNISGPRGDVTTLTWTDWGQIQSKMDPEGQITTIEYDENQNARSTTTTGLGKTIRVATTYDPTFSKLTQLQDGNNNVTNYRLDGKGNVHKIELPNGSSIVLDYFANGDLQRMVDQYGFVTTYENYDLNGNPRRIRRQTGAGSEVVTNNTFDDRSRLRTSDDTVAPSVANTYDALDRIVQQVVTDPSGYREQLTVTAQYLPEGEAKTLKRSGGGQTLDVENKYDGLSRLKKTTEVASGGAGTFIRNYTYDNNSNLLTEQNRRGVTITRTYDALNFVRSVSYSSANAAAVTTWDATGATDVDKLGHPVHFKDQYGQVTSLEYDGMHRVRLRTLPGDYTEEIVYDNNNNVVSAKDRKTRETTIAYDSLNRITSRRDPAGSVTTWTYDDDNRTVTMELAPQGLTETTRLDALGRLLSRQVRFGQNTYTTSNVYSGRQLTTTDPRGIVSVQELSAFKELGRLTVNGASPAFSIERHYGAFGAIKSTTDALSRESTYALDGLNRTTRITYPGGTFEQFAFDGEGLMVSHTDRRGTVSAMGYDNIGRPLTTQVTDGQETIPALTVSYDDASNKETRTDANNHTTTYFFDGLHRVRQLLNADGNPRNFNYDGINLTSEEDFKGKLTEYEYDAADRVKQIKDRTGQITNIANSDNGGYTKSLTDRRGNQRIEIYDPLGRLTRVTDGGGLVARYEYDGDDNRVLMVDGRNQPTSFSYDSLNRVKTIDHAAVQTETFTYDAVGNIRRYNDGRGPDVVMTYDDLNHLRTRLDGEGNLTGFQYDGEGLLRLRTDPKGGDYHTAYDYNALGSLAKVTDAKNREWRFSYDGVQNLKTVRDALDRVVSYDYDKLNRLKQITQPQDLITIYDYDANGNRKFVNDAKGQTTTIAYDDLDRPQSLTYGNTIGAGPRSYNYTYDPEGNLTRIVETNNPSASRSYLRSYDARNRLTSTTDPFSRKVDYTYDAANNLTLLKDAGRNDTSYDYDGRNRLKTVTMSSGPNATYTWYPDGLLQRVEYGADMKREYSYDNADRVTQITNTVGTGTGAQVQQFAYTYDANSNRQGETRTVDGQTMRAVTYGYDLLDRLNAASYKYPGQRPANPAPGQSASYTETTRETGFDFDAVGNRSLATAQDRAVVHTLTTDSQGQTSETTQNNDGPVLSASSQFDALNRLTHVSAAGVDMLYAYDNNGNLTSTTENSQIIGKYEYDVRDQLRRVANGSNQEIASYDYDCERQRLAKTVGGSTMQYVYGGTQVVNEYVAGSLLNRYDVGSDEVVRAELGGGEGSRYYFSEAQGSVTALARKAAGSLPTAFTAGYEYEAWGQYLSTSGSSSNSIGYTGQRVDGETGFMPLGNGERYYSSAQGRFLQQDSLTGTAMMAQSLNRYAYANNNPTRFNDPTGHDGESGNENAGDFDNWFHGATDAVGNAVMQPFEIVADILVEGETRREGIDRKYVKLSSSLGVAQQQAVAAGKDPLEVLGPALKQTLYGMATFGIGPMVEGTVADYNAYNVGWISRAEYYHRMGGHSAEAGMIVLALLGAAAGGGAAVESFEGVVVTAAERAPLSTGVIGALEETAEVAEVAASRALAEQAVTESAAVRAGAARSRELPILEPHFKPDAKKVLQNITNTVNDRLAANLELARDVLTRKEYAAGTRKPWLARMQYGNALERMVGNEIEASTLHQQLFERVGGPSNPDFIGRGGAKGMNFDITTPAAEAAHYQRPGYGAGLNVVTYQRPPTFVTFPK